MDRIENKIDFQNIEWEEPHIGVRQKVYVNGNQKVRLLIFSDDFVEKDWCINGHIGYVLDGEMKIDFNGTIKSYKRGDGLCIEKGLSSKHKAIIEKGKHVELILFEVES